MNPEKYAGLLQQHFAFHKNEYNAERMSKYMLNKFEFFGIQSPLRKQLAASFIHEHGIPAPEQLAETAGIIWQLPQRELHYVIMEICSRKPYMADSNRYELYKFMITTHSWWDTVDYIASNLVGAWLIKHKDKTNVVTHDLMTSGNMWLQRTALLFQLKYRQSTDSRMLFEFIEQLAASNEFFIRKAIGWALREYSKTCPEEVLNFVNNHELSGLSKREALRIMNKNQGNE